MLNAGYIPTDELCVKIKEYLSASIKTYCPPENE
jgi:hypothetical protein